MHQFKLSYVAMAKVYTNLIITYEFLIFYLFLHGLNNTVTKAVKATSQW